MVNSNIWRLFLAVSVIVTRTEANFGWQKTLAQGDPNSNVEVSRFPSQDWKQGCKEHRVGARETVTGDVHFGPWRHDEHPTLGKLSAVNSSSWEQWVFDSVSDNGSSGIFLSLGRDASYSFFGQGNLHVEFYALLEDGTKIQELAFADESSVYDCGDFVASTWTSESHNFEFRVPRKMEIGAKTNFTVSTPKIEGRFVLTGTAPGHFADGALQASPESSTQVAPGLHMHDTIPAAQVQGDIVIKGRRNESVLFSGMGGHLHLWAIDNWFKIIWGFRIIRGTAGPYSFFYWEPTSRLGGRTPYYTAILFKNGEKLVSTQASAPSDEPKKGGDYVRVLSTQHGRGARASVAERSTGHIIEFWSDGKQWRFELEHQYVQVQMPFGQNTGLAVFTNRVFGGEIEGCQYLGSAFSEEANFPEALAQWKMWMIYGIGMLSQLKARTESWLAGQGLYLPF
ncbi:hypothetical protein DHEL01_v202283 [Diaporthe helianthi]|uniref:Hydroxyneurosporene synthase n=1 Tax=Diaporthe helianthi TaxID=158607 RepID=A0A2P5I9Z7_DIAHE|nr:hypothetical protein DHEL01_v202283 [Diaporthe helianthi]